jgi:hypothetical protein
MTKCYSIVGKSQMAVSQHWNMKKNSALNILDEGETT